MPRECPRCQADTAGGGRCKNSTCDRYPYCWVHLKKIDGLVVKTSTIAGAGKGLFADKRFRPGETVATYSARRVEATSSGGAYTLDIGPNRHLNSDSKQNFVGRYVNDPRGTTKRANARFSHSANVQQKKGRATQPVKATKVIRKGDEVLVSYGAGYWNAHGTGKKKGKGKKRGA
jgi:hypothetical protein